MPDKVFLGLDEEARKRTAEMDAILGEALALSEARGLGLRPVTIPLYARAWELVLWARDFRDGLPRERLPRLVRLSGKVLEVWALPPPPLLMPDGIPCKPQPGALRREPEPEL